jgi:hypothetical protein
MEHVLTWVAQANAAAAFPALGAALGVAFADGAALAAFLLDYKSYVPVHQKAAEVLAGIAECRSRACALLNDIADVSRGAAGARTHLAPWPQQSTASTQVWRLQP